MIIAAVSHLLSCYANLLVKDCLTDFLSLIISNGQLGAKSSSVGSKAHPTKWTNLDPRAFLRHLLSGVKAWPRSSENLLVGFCMLYFNHSKGE